MILRKKYTVFFITDDTNFKVRLNSEKEKRETEIVLSFVSTRLTRGGIVKCGLESRL